MPDASFPEEFTRADLAALLRRLARGGKVEFEAERAALQKAAARLDDRPGKYDCPWCWLRRKIDGIADEVTGGRAVP